MAIHIVQTGDSLWNLSSIYGISVERLIEVNGLESTALVPGLALYIPEKRIENRSYAIKSGETLWQIATRYGTNVVHILEANPDLVPNVLPIGKKITIPSPYKNRLITLAFVLPQSSGPGFKMLEQHANQLSFAAIVAYSFTKEGDIYRES